MSNVNTLSLRAFVDVQNRLSSRTERGSQTAEYGVTVLVAAALALCVFGLITGGTFNEVISRLLKAVLTRATGLVSQ